MHFHSTARPLIKNEKAATDYLKISTIQHQCLPVPAGDDDKTRNLAVFSVSTASLRNARHTFGLTLVPLAYLLVIDFKAN